MRNTDAASALWEAETENHNFDASFRDLERLYFKIKNKAKWLKMWLTPKAEVSLPRPQRNSTKHPLRAVPSPPLDGRSGTDANRCKGCWEFEALIGCWQE